MITARLALLLTAATLALPAAAQTQPGQPGDAQPGGPTAPVVDAAAEEEIVVTGLRRSLESSQAIKQNSLSIVDSIVAEDIGKLPDRTVSEALARVPGVTVERQVAEAGDVFIRGLRDPATTYNGRDIFTAEARTVAPQDFPAGGVAGLDVYKALTSNLVEGNLAGLIDVRSRRPFDFTGFQIAGGLNGTYADLADDIDYNGNLLVTNRWDTAIGEIGILANVSHTQLKYLDSARFVSGDFFGLNPDPARPGTFIDNFGNNNSTTVRIPVGVGLFQAAGQRYRPSGNVSVQWKPSQNLQFYFDGLYQGFRREVADRLLFVPLFGASGYTGLTPSKDSARYGGAVVAANPVRGDGFQGATREKTDTYQYAVGGVFEDDRIKASFDVARTASQFNLSIYSVDYAFTSNPNVTAVFDTDKDDGGVDFDIAGLDTKNLANYRYRGFFDRLLIARGEDWQYRTDFVIKDTFEFLPQLLLGARYVDRKGGFRNGDRYSPQEGLGLAYGSLPLDFAVGTDGYRGNANPSVRQLNTPTYESTRNSIAALRTIAGFPQNLPPGDPLNTYEANETSTTLYSQANYSFGDIVDGSLGVRFVWTDTSLAGTGRIDPGGGQPAFLVPLEFDNSYTDVLPHASIRLRPMERVQLRFAYTETRTRPFFGDLNPGLRIDPPGGGLIRTARGGNPDLNPVQSKNYDLSLEYYFSSTGFASVAAFRRDVSGFIAGGESLVDLPVVGLTRVFRPINLTSGAVQGIEAQFRSFLDFEFVPQWARGFGTELNYTYIDNAARLPDVSEHTYNLVGFYERGPITARVAYNRRSRYVTSVNTGEFVAPVARLDASISFNLFENLTLSADVSNILAEPFRNFRPAESAQSDVIYPRDVRYEERVYSVGLRFRFGD